LLGVGWGLTGAFALAAAVSTAIVVAQFSTQSQNAVRSRAEALALASARLAAHDVTVAARTGATARRLPRIARQQDLELHVYDAKGVRIASASPHAIAEARRPERAALQVALQGERYVGRTSNGRVFVIGLPVAGGALVALNVRPDIAAAIAIVSDQALRAGVIAGLSAVVVGLVLAQLIALRLRRLSAAAEAMALGDFDAPAPSRFR